MGFENKNGEYQWQRDPGVWIAGLIGMIPILWIFSLATCMDTIDHLCHLENLNIFSLDIFILILFAILDIFIWVDWIKHNKSKNWSFLVGFLIWFIVMIGGVVLMTRMS
jgi:hypothetical protein